jgi:hypothetical protein
MGCGVVKENIVLMSSSVRSVHLCRRQTMYVDEMIKHLNPRKYLNVQELIPGLKNMHMEGVIIKDSPLEIFF